MGIACVVQPAYQDRYGARRAAAPSRKSARAGGSTRRPPTPTMTPTGHANTHWNVGLVYQPIPIATFYVAMQHRPIPLASNWMRHRSTMGACDRLALKTRA